MDEVIAVGTPRPLALVPYRRYRTPASSSNLATLPALPPLAERELDRGPH
jgi:hypothetical protein